MSGGTTPVAYPNVGPDAKSAPAGVAEFIHLLDARARRHALR